MTDKINIPDAGWYLEDSRDWKLDGASDTGTIRERLAYYAPKKDRDQYEWSQIWDVKLKSFCTAFAPMTDILSIKERDWETVQWNDFFLWAKENYWYQVGVGNYMTTGMKTAVNYWNLKHPDDPLVYYNLLFGSDDFFYALSLWYRLVIGWRFNPTYDRDRDEDKLINKVNTWKSLNSSYGHVWTIVQEGDKFIFIDNYKGRTSNRYEISRADFENVRRSNKSGFYPSAYVITSAKIIWWDWLDFETKKEVETLMQMRSNIWHKTNNTDIRNQLHAENTWYREKYNLK